MLHAMEVASTTPVGPLRVLLYDEVEKIAYSLSLYTYTSQGNFVAGVAAWLNPASINTNVTVGTEDNLYYELSGNNFLP